ncbi:RICIN domain-containing protein [Micromonospora deserti]|uniref:RICIN domain-containing protein n=1 Tax=Micromonospora deserti TaxID=2070366 RepID=UPI002D7653EA|nr:RICIN domain-containing protein [Micromonospora deserti]
MAARMAGMHPQTLRQYDRLGLVQAGRAAGGGRRYSVRDVVTLTNAAHGQCLDVEGGSTDDGTKLLQFPCHGRVNQQWRLTPTGTGPVLLVAVHSGKCGQVDDGGTEAGDDVEQVPCSGAVEQQWIVG